MTEFELKFEIPPASLKSIADTMRRSKTTRQRLQASYFDTADGALAEAIRRGGNCVALAGIRFEPV